MSCLLARRRREKNINLRMELEIYATVHKDIRQGHSTCHSFPAGLAADTINLIPLLANIPAITLGALHLMIAKEVAAESLVTSDQIMASGGKALGLNVVQF